MHSLLPLCISQMKTVEYIGSKGDHFIVGSSMKTRSDSYCLTLMMKLDVTCRIKTHIKKLKAKLQRFFFYQNM